VLALERRANPNPNASIANPVTIIFVPMSISLLLFLRLNQRTTAKLPKISGMDELRKDGALALCRASAWEATPLLQLLFVEKRQIGFVPSVFHLVHRNEMKGGGVNHVTLAGGRFRVGKDMAKAGITPLGPHLSTLHLV